MKSQTKPHPAGKSSTRIHRAPWLLADVSGEINKKTAGIVEDGALLVVDGRLRAVGRSRDIIREYPGCPVHEHEARVLAPALINSHCHLELSYQDLASNGEELNSSYSDQTQWIRDLLQARDNFFQDTAAEEQGQTQAMQVLQQMSAAGTAFVGDIGNSLANRLIGQSSRTEVRFLLELLGMTKESEALALARLARVYADDTLGVTCTAHAPYSTTPVLIREIKHQADLRNGIFSIHTAESADEVEFLKNGTGHFLNFLHERGGWDNTFKIPGLRSVQYLDGLGVLNTRTLCVHVVHVNQAEIELLASRKAKICLCPGSNRFLGVGKAPVTEFLAHGILPALGTDSKASNAVLNIWREMQLLREDHPALSPATVFSMATLGGAEAWGIAAELGTLEPGKQARFIAFAYPDSMCSADDILEYMTTAGEKIKVEWVEQVLPLC